MAKVTNGLKQIHRTSSFMTRAIEQCFTNVEFSKILVEYEADTYKFQLSAHLVDHNFFLKVKADDQDPYKCVLFSIDQALIDLNTVIVRLKYEEKKLRKNIKDYGVAFEDSSAVTMSSLLMLKEIISSLKPK
ncbi:hypothetical protein ACOJR9_04365 [Alteromonas sp. A081]|uniref:hypothetical protein n=1 Tax=Alteromonas sp. A081 TaxID=3410269 RepID=UPI003B9868CA